MQRGIPTYLDYNKRQHAEASLSLISSQSPHWKHVIGVTARKSNHQTCPHSLFGKNCAFRDYKIMIPKTQQHFIYKLKTLHTHERVFEAHNHVLLNFNQSYLADMAWHMSVDSPYTTMCHPKLSFWQDYFALKTYMWVLHINKLVCTILLLKIGATRIDYRFLSKVFIPSSECFAKVVPRKILCVMFTREGDPAFILYVLFN